MPLLFYALLFALPFGTRKLLYQFTPGFHEYETTFVYLSDVLVAAFIVFSAITYWRQNGGKSEIRNPKSETNPKPKNSKLKTYALLAFLLFAGVSIFFAADKWLALYAFARLLEVALIGAAVAYVLRARLVRFNTICAIIAASAVFQSLVAVAQFAKQGSIGLFWLGEPVLSAYAPGIAKFAVAGGRLLRAYGTFPHPNVLGAFLVLGLISLYYFLLRNYENIRKYESILLINGIFFIALGLVLTFSRAAWVVALIASIVLLLYGLARVEFCRRALFFLFALFIIHYSLFTILRPFILPRAHVVANEPAVVQRLAYNAMGFALIKAHPFGVGIGNQVLYAVQNGWYQKFGMDKAWQWEPVHNIYILMASEIGIGGVVAFMVFLVSLFLNPKSQARNSKQYQNPNAQNSKRFWIFDFGYLNLFRIWDLEFSISAAMLAALLLLGLADHYLWTLQQGRLLLWLAIGLAWGGCKTIRKGLGCR